MTVRRLLFGALRMDTKRTVEGYLRCDAMIARTGCQMYGLPGGKIRIEYRPPEEVFNADALMSAEEVPITYTPDSWNWHPPGPLTAKNAKKYIVGWTGSQVKQDGDFVKTSVKIFDADAIQAAENGSAAELSCGYACDLDFAPGVSPTGEKYDAIQRNIRINHVAMVNKARAGSGVRMKLDSAGDADLDIEPPPKMADEGSPPMPKMVINGIEVEVSDLAMQLLTNERKLHTDALATAQTARTDDIARVNKEHEETKKLLEKEKARADVAEAAKVAAEKARNDADDPKRIDAIVNQRVELFGKVKSVLGDEFKPEGKDSFALKKEALAKLAPEIKLDGKSIDYVEGLFDFSYSNFAKQNPAAVVQVGINPPPEHTDADPMNKPDPRAAFMMDQIKQAKKMGQPQTTA
jgi:hypothetical protein